MANEITVNTTYSFVSDDGTAYSENHEYFSDAATTASRARRVGFNATTGGPTVLSFGGTPSYSTQLTGPCLLFLVNRDERAPMTLTLSNSSGGNFSNRKLNAGEWLFLDVADSDEGAYADPLTYAAKSMVAVVATSENSDAKGEYLCIYKAAS